MHGQICRNLCPATILQLSLHLALINKKSGKYVFIAIPKPKAVQNLRNKNKPLPYTRTSGLLLHALVDIRLKKDNFGLHSLRLGGATLTSNKGVIKRQARWKSKNAKD